MAPPVSQVVSGGVGGLRRFPASAGAIISTGVPDAAAGAAVGTGPTTPGFPVAAPVMDILECPACEREFALKVRRPQVLSCGHTVCELCLKTGRHREACDSSDHDVVSENQILLQLLGEGRENNDDLDYFISMAYRQICTLASLLRPSSTAQVPALSRPMLRKLLAFVNSNLEEPFGLHKALKAARSLAERSLVEVILEQQSSGQLTASLWAAVRARGCQFLGPAMQEEVLKLVLLALEDGSALSRKVLVMFVVQRLSTLFPHASKTSIGHVVQLLYRASCFVVAKRDGDSSLMQLKEEFRTYESLRREHDAQIVSIACEAGLRIAPEQWSSLLYGDGAHRSHMQSIIDRLQAPQSLEQTARELASLASRANYLPLASLLQLLQQPLKVLEWQPDEVASSGGGKAVFDFISAAVSTVHYCLSLLRQQQQQQQGNGHKIGNGPPSSISIQPFQHQQQQSSQQQQQPHSQQQRSQHQLHTSPPTQHHTISSRSSIHINSTSNNNSNNNNSINHSSNGNICISVSSTNNINNNLVMNGPHQSNQSSNGGMPVALPSHPPPHPVYKYKVNFCRDMNNFGVYPRGAGCSFAYSIREQEHFRMRGKQHQHSRPQQPFPLPPPPRPTSQLPPVVQPSQHTHHQMQPQQEQQQQQQPLLPYHQPQRYPAAPTAAAAAAAAVMFHALTAAPLPPAARHHANLHGVQNHPNLHHSIHTSTSASQGQQFEAIEATR